LKTTAKSAVADRLRRRASSLLYGAVWTASVACARSTSPRPAPAASAVEPNGAASPNGSDFPVHVVDELGRAVTVGAEPHRIVSLLPSHTEILFDLGVGDRVVGVDDFSDYPPAVEKLPRVGNLNSVQVETVVTTKPDLVLSSEYSPTVATMAQMGLTVWAGSAQTLDEIYGTVTTLGKLVGRPSEAARLDDRIRGEIAAAVLSVRGLPRRRVYFEIDPTPYAIGPKAFAGTMLDMAGGDNVVPAALGEFPKVSPEIVAAANPEIIIGASLGEVAHRPGWGRIIAVQTKRVFELSPEERAIVVRAGPRVGEGIRILSRKLHPETPP
jgi:iron complex transport system substrate-binding protein